MTVVVDPYLIAIPSGNEVSIDSVRQYIGRLVNWDETFRTNPEYVVSSSAMAQIYVLDLQPDYYNLQKLLNKYGIDEIAALDVTEGCKTIIENYPQMEGKFEGVDVYCRDEKKKIIPYEIQKRMPPKVAEAFCSAMVMQSYKIEMLSEDDWCLATAPVEDYNEITVSGDVIDNERVESIEKIWPLLVAPADFKKLISVQVSIFEVFQEDPLAALKISWERIKQADPSIPELSNFRIRFMDQFIPSIMKNSLGHTLYEKDIQRVFDGITNALTNRWRYPGDKHHPLRKVVRLHSSDQQIRKKGNLVDRAVRIEISAGTNPLHVHYWKCNDGCYEISNLTCEHDDPTIYS
ncbi:MAG: hypothetical protein IMZ50_00675 [Candidatus Atribacteria bacterium]|nr:hypothetical protein [Candidatus Atribacteria bacterium]